MAQPRGRGLPCPYADGDPEHAPTRSGALEFHPDGTPPHRYMICADCYKAQFARKYPGEPVPDVSRVKIRGGPEFDEAVLAARAAAVTTIAEPEPAAE